MTPPREPLRLRPNQPPHFYRGGAAIAALRGTGGDVSGSVDTWFPEDWVASTTTRSNDATDGLTRLPDGRWLRTAVAADPHGWLGRAHVDAFGTNTALLVKLLDAGQRLPVHFHPGDAFARRHFDSHFGKTEAWIVVGTTGAEPTVYAGFHHSVGAETVREWVHEQDAPTMLDALNAVPVRPGDTVYVPAGLPHAIGEGVFVVELQQPTDLSFVLEWRDFVGDPETARLGLDLSTAIRALDTSAWDPERLRTLLRRGTFAERTTDSVLVPEADAFFRADHLRPRTPTTLEPSFGVLVVLDGTATLRTEHGGRHVLSTGDTWLVPHAAGELELTGETTILHCRPPSPRHVL